MTLLNQINPFDLTGPEFLAVYTVVAAVACFLAFILRRSAAGSYPRAPVPATKLDPYDAAYLGGGAKVATETAIASLIRSKALLLSLVDNTLSAIPGSKLFSHPFEQTVYRIVESGGATTVKDIRLKAAAATEKIATRLESLGLVVDNERSIRARTLPVILMSMVLLFGAIKILIGFWRDRPVGFLFVMCAITALIAFLFYKSPPFRTKFGDTALRQLKRENAALESTARSNPEQLGSVDVALAIALFGVTSLAFTDTAWAALRRQISPVSSGSSSSSSCGSSSSCSSSSSSGSSGCGGGCGGGGCGGCGS